MIRALRRTAREMPMLTTARTFLLLVCLATPCAGATLRLAELDTETIRALDRQRTAIIITGGILEQHGPYLPSYADARRRSGGRRSREGSARTSPLPCAFWTDWTHAPSRAIPISSTACPAFGA
jgi:hypothetical protein